MYARSRPAVGVSHAVSSRLRTTKSMILSLWQESGLPRGVQPNLARLANQRSRPTAMPMNVYRSGDDFVVASDLQGVAADAIELDVERNVLTVKAERRPPSPVTTSRCRARNDRGACSPASTSLCKRSRFQQAAITRMGECNSIDVTAGNSLRSSSQLLSSAIGDGL